MAEFLGVHGLPLFAAAALLLNLTPGPDMLFVAASGAAAGRRSGIAAALGVGAGCMLHIALAALGVSALLAASSLAFAVLTWAGAAYLVWMGLSMWRTRALPLQAAAQNSMAQTGGWRAVFWRGALTNALNPKVALFFLAFLPQFIEPQSGHAAWAFVALGLLFNAGGTSVNLVVAWLAGSARRHLERRSHTVQVLQRAAGTVFIALGIRLAASAR